MTRVRAVIFDAFGTLLKIQGGRHPYRQLLQIGRAQGRRPRQDDAELIMSLDLSFAQIAARLGIAVEPAQLADLEQQLADEVASIEVFDDGFAAVEALRRTGVRVGVCSNLASPYCAAVRGHFPALDGYALSCELGVIKPSPAIYLTACAQLGTPPSATAMIGDSRICDRDGPRQLGIKGQFLDRTEGAGDYYELVSFAHEVINPAI